MKWPSVTIRFWLGLPVAVSAAIEPGATRAEAVVADGAPAWPIPADSRAGPPTIHALHLAAATPPPAEQIADPVTPSASCGGWEVQSDHANRWPAGSSLWGVPVRRRPDLHPWQQLHSYRGLRRLLPVLLRADRGPHRPLLLGRLAGCDGIGVCSTTK